MATREQLHKEVDAVPDGQLPDAHVVVEQPQNGASPYLGLDDAARKRQQESLRKFQEELEAEGVEGGQYLPELERRAATWPE
jgi:hypothetical protein